jgi:hypothetical protein
LAAGCARELRALNPRRVPVKPWLLRGEMRFFCGSVFSGKLVVLKTPEEFLNLAHFTDY